MTTFLIGLAIGIAACEVAGRHLGRYSIVLDAADWIKARTKGIL